MKRIQDLDTPALLIDVDVMEANLRRVANYAAEHNLRLRPHTKTHKTPHLGRRQIELGAAGLTVAKTTEAVAMLEAQPDDLLIAYPVIGREKLQRLIDVAKRTRATVAVDSEAAARSLSEAAANAGIHIHVLAEVDVGLRRVGVQPGPELVGLAKTIDSLPGLAFEGIAFYPGHLKRCSAELDGELGALDRLLRTAVGELRHAGLEAKIVSGGSTPTLFHSHRVTAMNEIRPGTYIFNDRNTVAVGACGWEDCAASVLVTVVSTAVPGQIIVDGGSKTFSSDRNSNAEWPGFGNVAGDPGLVLERMNEEHGFVDVRGTVRQFRVGETLRVVPNHVCTAVNLHERLWAVRGEEVLEPWTVAARGKIW